MNIRIVHLYLLAVLQACEVSGTGVFCAGQCACFGPLARCNFEGAKLFHFSLPAKAMTFLEIVMENAVMSLLPERALHPLKVSCFD